MSRSSLSVWTSDVTPLGFTVHGGIQLGSGTWNALGFNCYTSVDGLGTNNHNVVIPNKGGYKAISNAYGVSASDKSRTFTCKCGGDFSWSNAYGRPSTNPVSTTVTVPAGLHYVYYDANGGSGAPGRQTKTWGTILTLSNTKPTRAGHTFKGWSTSQGGSVSYSPGGQYGADANVTLYAVWEINTYTVTFKKGYGDNAVLKEETVNYNSNATPPSVSSRTGYTFAGWDGSYTNVTSSRTITAKWTINKYYIDVNGSLDGEHQSGTAPMGTFDVYINNSLVVNDAGDYWQEHNYQTSYKIQDIKANTGYNYTGSSGSALSGNVPAGNVSISLNFTTKKYTVSFNANLGEAVSNMPPSFTKTHFVSVKLPSDVPTARRYEFLGWATSAGGEVRYRPGDMYSTEGGATLYAVWKLKASVVKVYQPDGTGKDGICSIYDDAGNHHYAILFCYDENGNRHEVL